MERSGRRGHARQDGAGPSFQRRPYHQYLVANFSQAKYKRFEGKTMASIADSLGKSMIDTDLRPAARRGLEPGADRDERQPVNVREFIRHQNTMLGSDALLIGEAVSPRTYGAAPTFLGTPLAGRGGAGDGGLHPQADLAAADAGAAGLGCCAPATRRTWWCLRPGDGAFRRPLSTTRISSRWASTTCW
ncbi:MAG: hypothetical protein U0531_02200 [Dehalococcoidia bacterium]